MSLTPIILNVYGDIRRDVLCTDPTAHVQIGTWDTNVARFLKAAEALHDPA